ncbi:MAG TPA: hypothetical protein VK821_13160 [Dehalococcoidia bacterium]|nr:hypothetical protein [Dehalococcoidia bacterium]
MASEALTLKPRPKVNATDRRDTWWIQPLIVVVVLGSFVLYATWAALINADYFVKAHSLLSPFYSPCLVSNCAFIHFRLIGDWWPRWLSPAVLILGGPLLLRVTCYYYRKAYYRSFFWAPPACSVPDAARGYSGERRFPLILQNVHRYAFLLSLVVLAFLWWDVVESFRWSDPAGIHMGVGSLVLLIATVLLTLYSLSCHSCRYYCGGCLDSFHGKPIRTRLWNIASRLNEKHTQFAWFSLFAVALADLYVRLAASGAIADLRIF